MKNKLLSLLALPAFALTMFGGAMSASADMQPDPYECCQCVFLDTQTDAITVYTMDPSEWGGAFAIGAELGWDVVCSCH